MRSTPRAALATLTAPRRVPLLAFAALSWLGAAPAATADLEWPPVTRETRPWTRWWWLGNSVEKGALTSSLEAYRDAGLGGVEITPIYGVAGHEDRFLPYLSPAWLDHLRHTLVEARRLDLGVDMATGTGWPFGGPWIGRELAPRTLAHKSYSVAGGQRLTEPVRFRQEPLVRAVGNQIYEIHGLLRQDGDPPPEGTMQSPLLRQRVRAPDIRQLEEPVEANANLQALALDQVKFPRDLPLVALVATSDRGAVVDLTARVGGDGVLDWVAPAGQWRLDALFAGDHGKMVERAAPGGEGNVIDHFSARAIRTYLDRFDSAFAGQDLGGLRAFFNDSYEVDDASGQADWTPAFLDEFQKRRGYDLSRHLPALFGEDAPDTNRRVLVDYRETISDLLLDTFTREWQKWAKGRGSLTRNQAHGSPANILDLYAATDIPETEGNDIMRMKWATSAAHVSGRRLASAEAATWLGEHFLSTLADVRRAVDLFFLSGVNHVVYHGTAYSPPADPWPGWLFYASVEFTPSNSWWTDFRALNAYVTRAQSFLQEGRPDNDVLLYFPFHEAIAVHRQGLLEHFGDARLPLEGAAFGQAAQALQKQGFGFDFVSDRQLQNVQAAEGQLLTGGASYKTVVVPSSQQIPLATLERLLALAREGATVVAFGPLAQDVSGLADLESRRAELRRALSEIRFGDPGADGVREAPVGRGAFLLGETLPPLLARALVRRESMVDRGLEFTRRRLGEDRLYFVVNRSEAAVDAWIPLAAAGRSVAIFDPMQGGRGHGRVRGGAGGRLEVYLQLAAGESAILVAKDASAGRPTYAHWQEAPPAEAIQGTWTVGFEEGGPERPREVKTSTLTSWTAFDGEAVKSFSGTATYTIAFPRPRANAAAYALDLGEVHQSARVRLNGKDLGTLIGPRFRVVIDRASFAASNVLEVSVSNLMANRIAFLDRRKVPWRKFYNVNFPSRLPANRGPDGLFHADHWTPLPSGLLGPVTLIPLEVKADGRAPPREP
jgi:hypothetical protein